MIVAWFYGLEWSLLTFLSDALTDLYPSTISCFVVSCFDLMCCTLFLRQLTPATCGFKEVLSGDLGPSRRTLITFHFISNLHPSRRNFVTWSFNHLIMIVSNLHPSRRNLVTWSFNHLIMVVSNLHPSMRNLVTWSFIGLIVDLCKNIRGIILLLTSVTNAFVYYIYSWYFFRCSMFQGRGSFFPSIVSRW